MASCEPVHFAFGLIHIRTTQCNSTVHSDDTQALSSGAMPAGPPARPPQGAQRERQGRRQGYARVRASCTRCRLVRRRRLPRANKGLPPFSSKHVEYTVPAAFASAIEPVIALPRGSVMLVGKVPSPALSSTRLGPPSFPSSTSRLSSPATSAAAIGPLHLRHLLRLHNSATST